MNDREPAYRLSISNQEEKAKIGSPWRSASEQRLAETEGFEPSIRFPV